MASSLDVVHYICDQAGLGSRLTFKRMFGEFALYVDGKVVAFVCDDQLYLKPSAEGRAFLGKVTLAPPYPAAKDYFLLASEIDESERLRGALEVTAEVMPEPKARRVGKPKSKAKAKLKPKSKSKPESKSKSKSKSKGVSRA
jgi:TfoX/Sxy family transcriptional regulator of competence genes